MTALVWLPDSVTEQGTTPYGRRPRPLAQAGFPVKGTPGAHRATTRPAIDPHPANDRLETVMPMPTQPADVMPTQTTSGTRETVQAASLPTSNWFRSDRPVTGADTPEATPAEGWATGKHAAEIIANPVHGDQTAAGLPVRIPQANLLPGSAGGGRRTGTGGTSRPADSHGTRAPAAPQPQRSPEKARNRLSGFQSGNRRAKETAGQTPRSEEGADR
jgi:hypothetical protein